MTTAAPEGASVLSVYWMPGCSSCLRMKEFVERLGIPHVAINAVEAPESAAALADLGLAVPAAVLGDRGVPGVDLVGIAQLAGVDYAPPPMLPPTTLHARYQRVLDVAERLIAQLASDQLDYREPDRPRTMRGLALHIVTIMRGFVDIEDTNVFGKGNECITEELASRATVEDILTLAHGTRTRLTEWWDSVGYCDPFDRVVTSHNGYWTLHEALERAVWHTAQHTRQLQFFVGHRFGTTPADRLTEADLAGLPLPAGIHAGGDG